MSSVFSLNNLTINRAGEPVVSDVSLDVRGGEMRASSPQELPANTASRG